MDLLTNKLKTSLSYLGLAVALAVLLPILLKNAFACSLGIAAMLLFGYQSLTYYKAIKNNDYVCVKVECVKSSVNDLGAATYARRCTFRPLDEEIVKGEFALQIVNDGNKKKGTKVYPGGKYEFVFKKSALNENDANDMTMFNNSTLLAYGPLQYSSSSETNTEQDGNTNSEEEDENSNKKSA